ncbi:hypothetical protein AOLE_12325 [Acinetobacter oleivorans DR1]|uniref:RHS protein conserved region domain-containing protein n=1 Tax=Acinetobacter oleivorans (strain JCM 16667 / KCTC 23045 / DR1) TaxID=436717 RepID=A0AAN0UDU2_ACISD|nr:hypothetical protein AOLE_12325 [Acinetobacter oleivorans DR1]ESK44193.1 hypothetical protein P254_01713 [Acinetobacter oleivorans CIP 110421]
MPLLQAAYHHSIELHQTQNWTEKTYSIYKDPLWNTVKQSQGFDDVWFYHCDHLGTPQEMTDYTGAIIWKAEYKAWGECKAEKAKSNFFENIEIISNNIRFQGQYFDEETGLHYNRYRYYSPYVGRFISKDPIGLLGGSNIYAYAPNPVGWVDQLGLAKTPTRTLQKNWKNYVGCKHTNSDIHHGFPEEYAERFKNIAGIDVNNPQYYYNLPKEKHTKSPGIHTNSSRTGQNWNKTWGGILNQVEAMNLSQAESKEILEQRLRALARKERIGKHNATAVKGANFCQLQ